MEDMKSMAEEMTVVECLQHMSHVLGTLQMTCQAMIRVIEAAIKNEALHGPVEH